MALSDTFLTELRNRADIETTISSYVNLKRAGRISKGLCPFHGEKTASFTVYPDTQSYYCFGCGNGGDVITFIKNIENLDYIDAVRFLADKNGMNMPEENSYDDTMNKRRLRMLEANREAAKFFHSCLGKPEGAVGYQYFKNRGLSDDTIRRFGLGFAPDSFFALSNYMMSKGYTKDELVFANLARRSTKNPNNIYDNFRNRVMFPIIDVKGNVIAFGGRVMDDSKPKYLNTSDTLVYKKSQGVFALNLAKKSGKDSLILCEGYMDVIALHQAGFTNAVAGLGTALTSEQAQLLSRYASEIMISYDADEAGQKAATRALEIFKNTTANIKVLHLSGGKDPDEILKNYGVEKMKAIINGAANEIEFALLRAQGSYDIASDDGKRKYLQEAIKILSKVGAIELDIYASRLADELSVSKDVIVGEAKRQAKRNIKVERKKEFTKIQTKGDILDKLNPQRKLFYAAAKAEEMLITLLMANPEFLKNVNEKISYNDFITDFNRRIYKAVTDRLCEGKSAEISFLAGDLTDDEISAVAKIQTISHTLKNTYDECEDCIKVIINEKNKKNIKDVAVENISDEEFLKFFKKDDN
ncbi:MAG: DNA primase [Clostridia bacterium]|nr:DNA primase [Clostridia bacterium]